MTGLITLDFQLQDAIAVERLVKDSIPLKPCKWCVAPPDDFMLPFTGMLGLGQAALFCSHCGKNTFTALTAECIPQIIRAWRHNEHPAHTGIGLIMERILVDSPAAAPSRINEIVVHFGEWSGLPHYIYVMSEHDKVKSVTAVYDWEIYGLIGAAINQAVPARLGTTPQFQRDTLFGCPHCGAGEGSVEWRNFNEVLREADLYCRACGEFIREWNP